MASYSVVSGSLHRFNQNVCVHWLCLIQKIVQQTNWFKLVIYYTVFLVLNHTYAELKSRMLETIRAQTSLFLKIVFAFYFSHYGSSYVNIHVKVRYLR